MQSRSMRDDCAKFRAVIPAIRSLPEVAHILGSTPHNIIVVELRAMRKILAALRKDAELADAYEAMRSRPRRQHRKTVRAVRPSATIPPDSNDDEKYSVTSGESADIMFRHDDESRQTTEAVQGR